MTKGFVVMGLRSKAPISDVKGFLAKVAQLSKDLGIEVQLVDASKVYGKEHLEVAAERALRAFEEGRNSGNTVAVEVLRYASCKRQISKAIKFMGLKDGTDTIGAVLIFAHSGKVPKDLLGVLGLVRDDKVLEGTSAVLEAFGITSDMRKGVPRARWSDLILEKVALMDIEK